jgi:hypothetical protein
MPMVFLRRAETWSEWTVSPRPSWWAAALRPIAERPPPQSVAKRRDAGKIRRSYPVHHIQPIGGGIDRQIGAHSHQEQ